MIHTQLRFQVSSRQKKKSRESDSEGTATGNPLYFRIMSDPFGASLNLNLNLKPADEAEAEPDRRPAGECECPMLRSMPLHVANFLLLSQGATATTTTTPFICSVFSSLSYFL